MKKILGIKLIVFAAMCFAAAPSQTCVAMDPFTWAEDHPNKEIEKKIKKQNNKLKCDVNIPVKKSNVSLEKLVKKIASFAKNNKKLVSFIVLNMVAGKVFAPCNSKVFCKYWSGKYPNGEYLGICYWKRYYYNSKMQCVFFSPTYAEFGKYCEAWHICQLFLSIATPWPICAGYTGTVPPCGGRRIGDKDCPGEDFDYNKQCALNSSDPEYAMHAYHDHNHNHTSTLKTLFGIAKEYWPITITIGVSNSIIIVFASACAVNHLRKIFRKKLKHKSKYDGVDFEDQVDQLMEEAGISNPVDGSSE